MTLRFAVPSDGPLYEPTMMFLRSCGIGVLRTNLRRYTAEIPALPGVTVLFQRAADITHAVQEGRADLGIIGLDRFEEFHREGGDASLIIDRLGYGHCELTVGVPDSWVDVTSLADLADLSIEFREAGSDLRIATKYPRVVSRFLLKNGINYFSLVHSSGTLEALPAMGSSDLIADISSTGTTMRENRLKTITGGLIVASEACLIANTVALGDDKTRLNLAKGLVERVEARLESEDFYSITSNMSGETPEEVARYVLAHAEISGLRGPTISKVYTRDGKGWYAVTIIVEKDNLLTAVDQLRRIGGSSVTVSQPDYVFHGECKAYARLTATG